MSALIGVVIGGFMAIPVSLWFTQRKIKRDWKNYLYERYGKEEVDRVYKKHSEGRK